jgi:hypothetical protein
MDRHRDGNCDLSAPLRSGPTAPRFGFSSRDLTKANTEKMYPFVKSVFCFCMGVGY